MNLFLLAMNLLAMNASHCQPNTTLGAVARVLAEDTLGVQQVLELFEHALLVAAQAELGLDLGVGTAPASPQSTALKFQAAAQGEQAVGAYSVARDDECAIRELFNRHWLRSSVCFAPVGELFRSRVVRMHDLPAGFDVHAVIDELVSALDIKRDAMRWLCADVAVLVTGDRPAPCV